MLNRVGWRGTARIIIARRGAPPRVVEVHNVITRAGRDLLRDSLRGQGSQEILYVGLGASTTAPTNEDLTLGDERFRKQVTSQQALLGPGELLTTVYISEAEANNFTIGELGWFAGAATAVAGSGTMIARLLFTHAKNNLETLQIDRTDAIVEVV